MQVTVLKRVMLLLLILAGFVHANGEVEVLPPVPYLDRPVTIHASKVTVLEVFKMICNQTDVIFSYTQPFNDQKKITFICDDMPLRQALIDLLTPLNTGFIVKGKYVIIKNERPIDPKASIITGHIYSALDTSAVDEASVYVIQTKHSTVSNNEGQFTLSYISKFPEVSVSFSKENYRDTSVVVFNKTRMELYVYLYPKSLPTDSIFMEYKSVVDEDEVVQVDSLVLPTVKEESSFWSRFRATHPNFRNITDTLVNNSSISLVPSISTNKNLSINTVNDLSLNILVGQSKGVNYAELGLLVNIVNGNVQWAQVAGVGSVVSGNISGGQMSGGLNSVSGDVLGGQAAGIANIDRGNLLGGQASGIINILQGDVVGGQLAGIININSGDSKGTSAAGIINISKGDVSGAEIAGVSNIRSNNVEGVQVAGILNLGSNVNGSQIAGALNCVDTIRGFQFAGIYNLSKYCSGFQLAGALNQAEYLKGSQLAFINLADSCDGVPIGFLSFVRSGYHKLELSTDEMNFVTLGFRTGVNSLHNIIFAGMNYSQPELYTFGYGLGSAFRLSKNSFFNLSATAQQVQKFGASDINMNLINKLYVGFDYTNGKNFGFSIGPSFNLMISDVTDVDYTTSFDKLVPYTFYNQTNNETNIKMWVGAQLSVRMF